MSWDTVTDIELIREYVDDQQSLRTLAAKHGVAYGTVRDRLKRLGIERRPAIRVAVHVVGADGLRPCRGKCQRRLPAEAFNRNRSRPDGLSDRCRACWSEYTAANTLMRRFGISVETFERLVRDQGGGCAICGKPFGFLRAGKKVRLVVDHCHRTGLVRGVLCSNCNLGIGCFKDTPELLEQAVKYLKQGGSIT